MAMRALKLRAEMPLVPRPRYTVSPQKSRSFKIKICPRQSPLSRLRERVWGEGRGSRQRPSPRKRRSPWLLQLDPFVCRGPAGSAGPGDGRGLGRYGGEQRPGVGLRRMVQDLTGRARLDDVA